MSVDTCTKSKTEAINSVITLSEASEILGVADSTIRMRVLKGGYFEPWEYRKAGGTILFSRDAILSKKDTFRMRKKRD